MKEQIILRTIARLTIPFIVVFGLYVIFHGEGGPGGGFQGGVILGAAVALHGIINGRQAARDRLPEWFWDAAAGIGVAIFAGIGVLCILFGGRMLQYDAFKDTLFHGDTQHANHYGVFGVEMGVALTVTAAMFTLFFEIARPDRSQDDES